MKLPKKKTNLVPIKMQDTTLGIRAPSVNQTDKISVFTIF